MRRRLIQGLVLVGMAALMGFDGRVTPCRTGPPVSGRADDGGAKDKHCSCGLDTQFGTVKQMRRGKCLLVLKMKHKTSRNACWHRCEFLLRCRWGLSRGSTFRRPACHFRVTFFCAVVAKVSVCGHQGQERPVLGSPAEDMCRPHSSHCCLWISSA